MVWRLYSQVCFVSTSEVVFHWYFGVWGGASCVWCLGANPHFPCQGLWRAGPHLSSCAASRGLYVWGDVVNESNSFLFSLYLQDWRKQIVICIFMKIYLPSRTKAVTGWAKYLKLWCEVKEKGRISSDTHGNENMVQSCMNKLTVKECPCSPSRK